MKRLLRQYGVVAVGAVFAMSWAVASTSCSGSKMRPVNVSSGEYYSEDEYLLLSDGEKSDYCRILETELANSQAYFNERSINIEETKETIASTRQQIVPIEKEILRLDAEIRTLQDQIEEVRSLPTTYKVKVDDTLTLIAMKQNVYNDIDKWWKIFEANKDKIEDPYYIFPDTVLVIPRDWPTE